MLSRTIAAVIALSSFAALAACVGDPDPATGDSDSGTPDSATATQDSGPGVDPVKDASTGKDAADAADAAPVFSPKSIAGLALWLDSDSASMTQSQGKVVAWGDKVRQGQQRRESAPEHVAHAHHRECEVQRAPDRALRHEPVPVRPPQCQFAIRQWRFSDVRRRLRSERAHGMEALFSKRDTAMGNSPGPALYVNNAGGATAFTALFGGVGSATTGLDNGSPHYIAAHRTGTTLVVEVDGTETTTTIQPLAATTGDGVDLQIGAELVSGFQSYLTGDLGEMAIVLGTVSAGDDTALRQYMLTKYGISTTK